MRKDDYKLHLDKIKCSDEFRRKMEELLSAEQEEIYAESVTTVERAGRINIQRWSGLAASAVLLLGIGGVAVHISCSAGPGRSSFFPQRNRIWSASGWSGIRTGSGTLSARPPAQRKRDAAERA